MESFGLDGLDSRSRPFFVARRRPDGVRTEGTPTCQVGHVLPGHAGHGDDGLFVRWEWDGEQLLVENDRYGIYPLFYSHCHGEIRISPAIQHVLDGDFQKSLDFPALAVFLRWGFFIEEDTPFEQVQVMPPGSRMTWREGTLNLTRGSRTPPVPEITPATFDEAVETYQALFRQAIARRPPPAEGFDIPLSGGRDSRHILLELLHQGYKPNRAVTIQGLPPINNEDLLVARLVARQANVEHDEAYYKGSLVAAILKDLELTGFCSAPHTWLIALAGYLNTRRTVCTYDGLAGDVLSGAVRASNEKLQLLRKGRTQELAKTLLAESGQGPAINACYRPAFVKRIPESLAVDRLSTELARHQHTRSPLVSFVFWNITRRGISLLPFGLLGHVDTTYCPYLDHDLFNFLINFPPERTGGGAFHSEVIKRSYPEFANIPFDSPEAEPPPRKTIDAYYRRAALNGCGYLLKNPKMARSRLVKTGRLAAMLSRSLVAPRAGKPWYLQPLLRRLELEHAIGGPIDL